MRARRSCRRQVPGGDPSAKAAKGGRVGLPQICGSANREVEFPVESSTSPGVYESGVPVAHYVALATETKCKEMQSIQHRNRAQICAGHWSSQIQFSLPTQYCHILALATSSIKQRFRSWEPRTTRPSAQSRATFKGILHFGWERPQPPPG